MGRPNKLDAPVAEILRNAGTDGMLATEVSNALVGVGSVRGIQFSFDRLMQSGLLARRFEWYLWPEGTPKAGLPKARVYRYFLREFAPEDAEAVA